MIVKTDSTWSDYLLNCLWQGNVNPFAEEEIREWAEWTELKDSALLLEHLLSETQVVH